MDDLVGKPDQLSADQICSPHELLGDHHEVFCIEDNEQGETNVLTIDIFTGDAQLKKLPVCRMILLYEVKLISKLVICRLQE